MLDSTMLAAEGLARLSKRKKVPTQRLRYQLRAATSSCLNEIVSEPFASAVLKGHTGLAEVGHLIQDSG